MSRKIHLDEIDRRIISILQQNGRTALVEIGRKTGMTHVGVKRRLERLVKGGLIRISANVDISRLKFKAAIILVEVENYERLQQLIEMFKNCPRIICLATLSGTYNLMVLIAAEDMDTLESMILGECAIRGQRGIRKSDVQIIESFYYPVHFPLRMISKGRSKISPCGLRCDKCGRYKLKKCLACPATIFYRGFPSD